MWIYKELEKRLCRCLYILFLTAASFADFCIFSVPPPSLGIVSVPLNWMYKRWLSVVYICRFYILHRQIDHTENVIYHKLLNDKLSSNLGWKGVPPETCWPTSSTMESSMICHCFLLSPKARWHHYAASLPRQATLHHCSSVNYARVYGGL